MAIGRFEKLLAGAAFLVAAALAFISLLISENNDIAAGVLMAIAQFLLLAASILHIDYKLSHYGSTSSWTSKQQPSEHQSLNQ